MINVITKLGDIATEFKVPLLAAGNYGWYFNNTNKASAAQPNVDSITSWVGYDHSASSRAVVRFQLTARSTTRPMDNIWLSSGSSLDNLNISDDIQIRVTAYGQHKDKERKERFMLSVLTKIAEIASEFGTTLPNKTMRWFYTNKNSLSPHQPNYNSIKSWIGYNHNPSSGYSSNLSSIVNCDKSSGDGTQIICFWVGCKF